MPLRPVRSGTKVSQVLSGSWLKKDSEPREALEKKGLDNRMVLVSWSSPSFLPPASASSLYYLKGCGFCCWLMAISSSDCICTYQPRNHGGLHELHGTNSPSFSVAPCSLHYSLSSATMQRIYSMPTWLLFQVWLLRIWKGL